MHKSLKKQIHENKNRTVELERGFRQLSCNHRKIEFVEMHSVFWGSGFYIYRQEYPAGLPQG